MDRQNEQQIIFQYLQHVRKLYEESSVPVVYKPGHTEERMLPTNDGVRLRTEYCFPEGVKRVPAIVMRCCYKQHAPLLALHAEEYTKRGFAFIIQWCRGMNGSEGKWEPNVNEREDGLDALPTSGRSHRKYRVLGGFVSCPYRLGDGGCCSGKGQDHVSRSVRL